MSKEIMLIEDDKKEWMFPISLLLMLFRVMIKTYFSSHLTRLGIGSPLHAARILSMAIIPILVRVATEALPK